MNHELICTWLGLPPGNWPPDHYRLLGLDPGESDVELIEQRVHQRLDSVRRYQMTHPEPATEAMNRLAQAFVCLTDPAARQAYNTEVGIVVRPQTSPANPAIKLPSPSPVASPQPLVTISEPTHESTAAHVWFYTPGMSGPDAISLPPLRTAPLASPEVQPLVEVLSLPAVPEVILVVSGTPEMPIPEMPAVEVVELPVVQEPIRQIEPIERTVTQAMSLGAIRRRLGTRRQLYERILHTRRLQRMWHKLGKFLDNPNPKQPLSVRETSDLYKLIQKLDVTIDDFPLLAEPGQPGYLILSLIRVEKSNRPKLEYALRESLCRDWKTATKFLEAYRDFLRKEVAQSRSWSRKQRLLREFRGWINEQPSIALGVLWVAFVAIVLAFWRSYIDLWYGRA
jgi:hypothetical protein